jgi:TonB family protein
VVVGALFVSAVVFSIYASEVGLGNDSYELTALLTPVQAPAEAPEPPQQKSPKQVQPQAELPTRQTNMLRVDEPPRDIPPVSTAPNTEMSRPNSAFVLGTTDTNPSQETTLSVDPAPPVTEVVQPKQPEPVPEPKPDPKPEAPKPAPIRSLGVVNGFATNLPKPIYPAPALALRIEGKVNVQIMIDETGKVVSAKAVDGNPLLRQASENAALGARFKPTTLSTVPVKVTGVIVYNFTRN